VARPALSEVEGTVLNTIEGSLFLREGYG